MQKATFQIDQKKILWLKKFTLSWTYVISDFNDEEIVGIFYEKELQKTNEKEFRVEKLIKEKGDRLYVKWKNFDKTFGWKTKVEVRFEVRFI